MKFLKTTALLTLSLGLVACGGGGGVGLRCDFHRLLPLSCRLNYRCFFAALKNRSRAEELRTSIGRNATRRPI